MLDNMEMAFFEAMISWAIAISLRSMLLSQVNFMLLNSSFLFYIIYKTVVVIVGMAKLLKKGLTLYFI
jgi:hypothetical protein